MGLRQAYEEKMDAQLQEWGAKFEELRAQADKAEADAKIQLYAQIEALRAKQVAAAKKLRHLKEAGEDSWEDIRAGVESAWGELGKAVDTTISNFKKS